MVVFAAATGLRPAELFALEQRDVDLAAGAVYVRRAFAYGRLKKTKTRRSLRAVPPQKVALEALAELPRSTSPLLFPAPRGGYIDLRNFRRRQWKPAQMAAGIDPLRQPYDLRHTYATFALRAGVSIFDLSRFMGASLAMIDRHYGLARDGREHAVALLDALAADETAWTFGGRRNGTVKRLENRVSEPRTGTLALTGGRSVDVASPAGRLCRQQKESLCRSFPKAL
jgi:integrase